MWGSLQLHWPFSLVIITFSLSPRSTSKDDSKYKSTCVCPSVCPAVHTRRVTSSPLPSALCGCRVLLSLSNASSSVCHVFSFSLCPSLIHLVVPSVPLATSPVCTPEVAVAWCISWLTWSRPPSPEKPPIWCPPPNSDCQPPFLSWFAFCSFSWKWDSFAPSLD